MSLETAVLLNGAIVASCDGHSFCALAEDLGSSAQVEEGQFIGAKLQLLSHKDTGLTGVISVQNFTMGIDSAQSEQPYRVLRSMRLES